MKKTNNTNNIDSQEKLTMNINENSVSQDQDTNSNYPISISSENFATIVSLLNEIKDLLLHTKNNEEIMELCSQIEEIGSVVSVNLKVPELSSKNQRESNLREKGANSPNLTCSVISEQTLVENDKSDKNDDFAGFETPKLDIKTPMVARSKLPLSGKFLPSRVLKNKRSLDKEEEDGGLFATSSPEGLCMVELCRSCKSKVTRSMAQNQPNLQSQSSKITKDSGFHSEENQAKPKNENGQNRIPVAGISGVPPVGVNPEELSNVIDRISITDQEINDRIYDLKNGLLLAGEDVESDPKTMIQRAQKLIEKSAIKGLKRQLKSDTSLTEIKKSTNSNNNNIARRRSSANKHGGPYDRSLKMYDFSDLLQENGFDQRFNEICYTSNNYHDIELNKKLHHQINLQKGAGYKKGVKIKREYQKQLHPLGFYHRIHRSNVNGHFCPVREYEDYGYAYIDYFDEEISEMKMISFRYHLKMVNYKKLNFEDLKFGIPVTFNIALFKNEASSKNNNKETKGKSLKRYDSMKSVQVEVGSNYDRYKNQEKNQQVRFSKEDHDEVKIKKKYERIYEAFDVQITDGIYKGIEIPTMF